VSPPVSSSPARTPGAVRLQKIPLDRLLRAGSDDVPVPKRLTEAIRARHGQRRLGTCRRIAFVRDRRSFDAIGAPLLGRRVSPLVEDVTRPRAIRPCRRGFHHAIALQRVVKLKGQRVVLSGKTVQLSRATAINVVGILDDDVRILNTRHLVLVGIAITPDGAVTR
jgi:hypothetical protein